MEQLQELVMSPEEYLDWESGQDARYEYVGGRVRMMVGSSRTHNRITNDTRDCVQAALERQGSPCEAYQTDIKVMTPRGNYRYPDVVVDCADVLGPNDNVVTRPVLIIEVLSEDSTSYRDQTEKLDEYKSIPSVMSIVLLGQTQPRAEVYQRHNDAWLTVTHIGLESVITLSVPEIILPMGTLYSRAPFGRETP